MDISVLAQASSSLAKEYYAIVFSIMALTALAVVFMASKNYKYSDCLATIVLGVFLAGMVTMVWYAPESDSISKQAASQLEQEYNVTIDEGEMNSESSNSLNGSTDLFGGSFSNPDKLYVID